MKNGEQGAFGYGFANNESHQEVTGLTKREYFAAVAMQGIMSSNECGIAHIPSTAAEWAVSIADALLAELEKPQP
tara:strand:- start:1092 stop:1316 length:225 start_codon:yes stop_codon:yes gene_type:complete